jgi:hypothetical protein
MSCQYRSVHEWTYRIQPMAFRAGAILLFFILNKSGFRIIRVFSSLHILYTIGLPVFHIELRYSCCRCISLPVFHIELRYSCCPYKPSTLVMYSLDRKQFGSQNRASRHKQYSGFQSPAVLVIFIIFTDCTDISAWSTGRYLQLLLGRARYMRESVL